MRVLQLIDSLRPGGAEKMAVNIANALLPYVERSYLCCTRQEGMLKQEVKPEVGYLFLNKKSRLDPKAILGLWKYIINNKIDIVHAHSTSFFLAGLLKLSGGNFKLIWHDHYGESENLENREFKILKRFSRLFAGIISVNFHLKEWSIKNLECKNVVEINNFIPETILPSSLEEKILGPVDAFKIICVANFRPQKDHLNLLKAFELVHSEHPEVTLHLIGEDPQTKYSDSVFNAVKQSSNTNNIFYYGAKREVSSFLSQAHLGVLSSRSEGLPLALLEYGMAGVAVVCTNVGKCREVIGSMGKIVPKENSLQLSKALLFYIQNELERKNDAFLFNQYIRQNYSSQNNVVYLLDIYQYEE